MTDDHGQLHIFADASPVVPSHATGRFSGSNPTRTERESGDAVEERDLGPLRPGTVAHKVLRVFGDGQTRTAYHASRESCGDFHGRRREATRLYMRGFVVKRGTLPNPAPSGRSHVDAFVITEAGRAELRRLDGAA